MFSDEGGTPWGSSARRRIYWLMNALGMWLLAWGCGVVHADGSAATFGESCALMGMLGCAILIPGPPGMLGVFQAGIYAGMTMFYPSSVVTGAGAAYVFLMYASQCVFQVVMGGVGLAMDRSGSLRALEDAEGVAAVDPAHRAPRIPKGSSARIVSPAACAWQLSLSSSGHDVIEPGSQNLALGAATR